MKFDKIQQAGELVNKISEADKLSPIVFVRKISEFKKIREIKSNVNFFTVLGEMFSVISNLQAIKGGIADINKSDISRLVLNIFSDLSLEEIYKAFELERFGVIGVKTEHFQLFNADYVNVVLRKYKLWRQNMRIQHNITLGSLTTNLLPEKSQSQKDEEVKSKIIELFNNYIETGIIEEPCFFYFDFLLEKEIIKKAKTPELIKYYNGVLKKAKLELQNEYDTKKSIYKSERNDIKKELSKIMSGNSNKIEIKAKSIVLKEFFNNLVVNNKNIKEILYKNSTN